MLTKDDAKDLSPKERADLIAMLESVNKEQHAANIEKAKAQIEEAINAACTHFSVTRDDIGFGDGKKPKSKGKMKPKYAHPDDSEKVYKGHGRKPKWLEEWFEAGHTLDELTKL